ncbi:MAG TPA: hypothetical protein VF077_11710 [Nitrospiraceae bacterium]
MKYVEIYATNGVGWRIPIDPACITPAKNGKITIENLPSIVIDETVTIMNHYAITSDDDGTMKVLLTGSFDLKPSRTLHTGETLQIKDISIGFG